MTHWEVLNFIVIILGSVDQESLSENIACGNFQIYTQKTNAVTKIRTLEDAHKQTR